MQTGLAKFITSVLFNQIWSNQFCLILNNVNYLGKLQNALSIAKPSKAGLRHLSWNNSGGSATDEMNKA
jgi:hypothetical protein